jgi:hypothetical protein
MCHSVGQACRDSDCWQGPHRLLGTYLRVQMAGSKLWQAACLYNGCFQSCWCLIKYQQSTGLVAWLCYLCQYTLSRLVVNSPRTLAGYLEQPGQLCCCCCCGYCLLPAGVQTSTAAAAARCSSPADGVTGHGMLWSAACNYVITHSDTSRSTSRWHECLVR